MTALQFEEMHHDEWAELELFISSALGRRTDAVRSDTIAGASLSTISGDRAAALYRRACGHLALARARAYPAYLIDRLDRLTASAHQAIYQRRELTLTRMTRVATIEFPVAVRRHAAYVAVATAVFLVPTIVVGLIVYVRPELILSVVSPDTAASFEQMYSSNANSIGRLRTASTDWMMFGYYIRNNIGIAFQCFAGGLFAGVGTLFFLAYNGAFSGALAGYLTERGLSSTFYAFVATHSAFELTAIVLAGAAGLRIGHALLAPGRSTRRQSLVVATREAIVVVYGVTVMLLVAAAVEAFWSSSRWLGSPAKYAAAAVCWTAVISYLCLQGRRAD